MLILCLDQNTLWHLKKRRKLVGSGPSERDCSFVSRYMFRCFDEDVVPEKNGINVCGCNASLEQLLYNGTLWANMVNVLQHVLVDPRCIAAPVL